MILKIIEEKGDNTYLLPHKKKVLLEREGKIKTTVVIGDEMMKQIRGVQQLENQTTLNKYFQVKTKSRTNSELHVS